MAKALPQQVDTVIVGNGPSALILSYILHGHIPIYDLDSPHPDAILHEKLRNTRDLLNLNIDHLTEHFAASRFSYSTQALLVNVLVDTLIRPYGETEDRKTCVKWQYDPSRAISHVVVGDTPEAGGQWANNPVKASWNIGTLSYAGMLSLPGYGFDEHYREVYGTAMPLYLRPSRRQIAGYLSAYPHAVHISDAIRTNVQLSSIARTATGFRVGSHDIDCNHLVLASGVFSVLIPPRSLLQPLLTLPSPLNSDHSFPDPLLVIGSGFSAADVIISAPSSQKIIHIFKWAPKTDPSPLRNCHQQAYPEYAGVYRKMKLAAISHKSWVEDRPRARRPSSTPFELGRDWQTSYEGLPNTYVVDVRIEGNSRVIELRDNLGNVSERRVCGLVYVVGRRGTFDYLSPKLREEIAPGLDDRAIISARTMRERANEDLEVAKNVFIIGSLTGDSLVRFAYGGCFYAARNIMPSRSKELSTTRGSVEQQANGIHKARHLAEDSPLIPAMNGFDGHEDVFQNLSGSRCSNHIGQNQ